MYLPTVVSTESRIVKSKQTESISLFLLLDAPELQLRCSLQIYNQFVTAVSRAGLNIKQFPKISHKMLSPQPDSLCPFLLPLLRETNSPNFPVGRTFRTECVNHFCDIYAPKVRKSLLRHTCQKCGNCFRNIHVKVPRLFLQKCKIWMLQQYCIQ